MKLTKAQRLVLYKYALKRCVYPKHKEGICDLLIKGYNKLYAKKPYDGLSIGLIDGFFPELSKLTPLDYHLYWYTLNKEGHAQRRNDLMIVIDQMEKK